MDLSEPPFKIDDRFSFWIGNKERETEVGPYGTYKRAIEELQQYLDKENWNKELKSVYIWNGSRYYPWKQT